MVAAVIVVVLLSDQSSVYRSTVMGCCAWCWRRQ
jgi:hypothetical protein